MEKRNSKIFKQKPSGLYLVIPMELLHSATNSVNIITMVIHKVGSVPLTLQHKSLQGKYGLHRQKLIGVNCEHKVCVSQDYIPSWSKWQTYDHIEAIFC